MLLKYAEVMVVAAAVAAAVCFGTGAQIEIGIDDTRSLGIMSYIHQEQG